MSRFLRQSTAANLIVGPFVDDTDGKTAETGLTLTPALTLLSKNGSDPTAKNEATNAVHKANGFYLVTVDATDTNTIGRLRLSILGSGALPVWEDYTVLDEAVYDVLFGVATMPSAAELAKVKGAVGGKIVVSADGLTVEKYDAAGNLLVTLVRTGTGPYTWTPTWA